MTKLTMSKFKLLVLTNQSYSRNNRNQRSINAIKHSILFMIR